MNPPTIGLSILLVEDNPRHAELIRDEIETEIPGALVTVAGGVAESRSAIAGRAFDLALLDFRLP
ncbi:DNA-binding response regulator, partial [bacterium]|nr:DNA-binding response regulator [bacterium]